MSFFTVLLSSKIAVGALAVGTIAAGGTAAAAYTGTLPASLQQSAHSLIGAPAQVGPSDNSTTASTTTTLASDGTESPKPTATPVGPDATGPAAYGLCQAYTHGGLATSSTAYGSLLAASSGSADITAYCATITSPGQSASHRAVGAGVSADANGHVVITHPVTPVIPELPSQATHPILPQLPSQAAVGIAHKPATPGHR